MNQIQELDKLISNCDYITKHCNHFKSDFNDEVNKKCNKLLEVSEFFNQISPQYTFKNIPHNGFKLFINVATAFTDKINYQIKNKKKIDPNFIKIFSLIFFYADWILDVLNAIKNEEIESEEYKSLMCEKIGVSSKFFYHNIHGNEDAYAIKFNSKYIGFWLGNDFQKIISYLFRWFAFTYDFPMSITSVFNDKKKSANYCAKTFKNCNLKKPFDFWHQSEGFFVSTLTNYFINNNIPVTSRTVYIPKQTRFRITYKGKILDFDKLTKEEKEDYFNDKEEQERQNSPGLRHRNKKKIRCRYSFINSNVKIKESLDRIEKNKINGDNFDFKYYTATKKSNYEFKDKLKTNLNKIDSDYNPEKILVLHLHGGALFTQGAKSSELFLRNIVNQLCGIPILSVDYSLTVPFPIQNQEVLDVYLFLLSGEDKVLDLIGFHPKKIVIFSDSAGSFFAVQNTIIINEINKLLDNNENKIEKPSNIVALYPAISFAHMTPAKCLFSLEPLLEFHIILLAVSMYGANVSKISDFKKIEKTELFQQIALKNKKLFDENIIDDHFDFDPPKKSNDNSPWFSVDYKTYKNYADYIATFYQNFTMSPILYDKFDELKDTGLSIIIGEDDLLIDDCIQLANLWQSDITLDVIPKLIHGFIQLEVLSPNAKKAINLIVKRLQISCNLV